MASSLESPTEIPVFQKALRASGIPIAALAIGKVDRATFQTLAALTSVTEFKQGAADAPQQLGAFVSRQARRAASVNYRLRYRASESGAATRKVALSMRAAPAVSAAASSRVPPATERSLPSGIVGLYVTIDLDGKSVRRRLGGLDVNYRGIVAGVADATVMAEALAAVNGLHTIYVEPAQPTIAAVLDDALSAALSIEPVWDAKKTSLDAMTRTFAGLRRFDPSAALLLDPVAQASGDRVSAVPDGLRVMVSSDVPTGGPTPTTVHKMDVIPEFNGWVGVGSDAKTAFAAAMRRSLTSSLREGRYLTESAAQRLNGSTAPRARAHGTDTIDHVVDASPARGAGADARRARYDDPARAGERNCSSRVARGSGHRDHDCPWRRWTRRACSAGDAPALQMALLLLSAACVFRGPATGTIGFYTCVGADAYGAATAVAQSFDNAVAVDVNERVWRSHRGRHRRRGTCGRQIRSRGRGRTPWPRARSSPC